MSSNQHQIAGGNMSPGELVMRRLRKQKPMKCSRYIVGLLKSLGVPEQMLYVRQLRQKTSFWLRPINHLEVLEEARNRYRTQISVAHPDKPGGCAEQAAELNRIWSVIEKRFRDRGHELW